MTQAKHLQFVSGVDAVSYWLGTFTWDFINYLIPSITVLILIAAFQLDEYKDDLGTVFLMLVSHLKMFSEYASTVQFICGEFYAAVV